MRSPYVRKDLRGSGRGLRGGSWNYLPIKLAASIRGDRGPASEDVGFGFRVASPPEPGTGLLVVAGLLGVAGWRRRRG